MKAYGGACPLCCGDIKARLKGGSGVTCTFCGAQLDERGMTAEPLPFLARSKAADSAPVRESMLAEENVLPLFEPARGRPLNEAGQRAV